MALRLNSSLDKVLVIKNQQLQNKQNQNLQLPGLQNPAPSFHPRVGGDLVNQTPIINTLTPISFNPFRASSVFCNPPRATLLWFFEAPTEPCRSVTIFAPPPKQHIASLPLMSFRAQRSNLVPQLQSQSRKQRHKELPHRTSKKLQPVLSLSKGHKKTTPSYIYITASFNSKKMQLYF